MTVDFSGKVAFVTGGSKGIGRSIVETLITNGADVGAMARGRDDLDAAVADFNV